MRPQTYSGDTADYGADNTADDAANDAVTTAPDTCTIHPISAKQQGAGSFASAQAYLQCGLLDLPHLMQVQ